MPVKINYQTLNKIKQQIHLPKLIQESGVRLNQFSKDIYHGKCPFHQDNHLMLRVFKKDNQWIWHCFCCKRKGSVIDWLIQHEKKTFAQAYQALSSRISPIRPISPIQILNSVFNYYENTFRNSQKAQNYLKSQGITDPQVYKYFRIGFSNGSLPINQSEETQLVKELKAIGILNNKSQEIFRNCLIFPLQDPDQNIVGLETLDIETASSSSSCTGAAKQSPFTNTNGLFNARAFKINKKIYLTDTILNALKLFQKGKQAVTTLSPNLTLTQTHKKYIKDHMTREIILCINNKDLSQKITKQLNALGVVVKNLSPDFTHDPGSKDAPDPGSEMAKIHTTDNLEEISFSFPTRNYRIRGLNFKRVDNLRCNIRLSTSQNGSHLDTFDLYSAKARENFIKMTNNLLKVDKNIIYKDLYNIIEHLEKLQTQYLNEKDQTQQTPQPMTPDERDQALKLLKNPNLFTQIIKDFHTCGYVGEEDNLLMGYICATSRKLQNPLSLLIISRSAAGKTSLQNAVLSFIPEHDLTRYTRITDQSLFYHDETALFEKVLAIEEQAGAKGANYALRNVLTSKSLSTGSTIKDPKTGKLKSQNTKIKIQTSVFLTTTQTNIHYETLNRFIIASIDESPHQTSLILEHQRRLHGPDSYKLKQQKQTLQKLHQNAQTLLEEIDIVNPYQHKLTFTNKTLRARREQIKYLTLINTIAFIRQYQKKHYTRDNNTKYIEVDHQDIQLANKLAKVFITKNLDYLSPPARRLYEDIRKMTQKLCKQNDELPERFVFSRRQLIENTGWSQWQIRSHIKELIEAEYIIQIQGKQGQRCRYKLAQDINYQIPQFDVEVTTIRDRKIPRSRIEEGAQPCESLWGNKPQTFQSTSRRETPLSSKV